jgi:ribosomal-protein-alanine N-acetyltransferase
MAKALLSAMLQQLQQQGVLRVHLEVRESNAAARALYEQLGFAITGRRDSYYRTPSEAAVLYTHA